MRTEKGGQATWPCCSVFRQDRQMFEQEIGPATRLALHIIMLAFLYRFGDSCVFHTRYLSRRFEAWQKTRMQTFETAILIVALSRCNKTWSFLLREEHWQFLRDWCWGKKTEKRKTKWIITVGIETRNEHFWNLYPPANIRCCYGDENKETERERERDNMGE